MAIKTCVKISFKGLTQLINCDLKLEYDELINTILDKFNIPLNNKMAIEIYDEQGQKYGKETFEYFLLLFPNPKKIFFIRLDSTKMKTHQNTTNDQHHRDENDDTSVFGRFKLNHNSQATKEKEAEDEYVAVPVRRQNCFIGKWPTSTKNYHQRSPLQQKESEISMEIINRMKSLKQNLPKNKRLLKNSNAFKRSLRL